MLLAALMQAAGKHVRFAHGDLDEKAATQLVQSTWTDQPAEKKASASAPDPVKKAFEAFQTARDRDFHPATGKPINVPNVHIQENGATKVELKKESEEVGVKIFAP